MMNDDDFKLLRGFDNGRTDEQTDEQTFVIVESLSRLKSIHSIPISYIIPKKFPESEIKQVGLGLHTILFISVFTISISSYFNPVAPIVSWVILAS